MFVSRRRQPAAGDAFTRTRTILSTGPWPQQGLASVEKEIGLSRTGLSRTGLSRTGLSRSGLSGTGQSRKRDRPKWIWPK